MKHCHSCLSFILLFSAPLQPLTDSCKNYCKVLVMIFTGEILTLILLRVKEDGRHWENISWGMLSKEVILPLLSKGSSDYTAGKYRCWCFSPSPAPIQSMYKTSLSFKSKKVFLLCDQKAKSTNTALLVRLNFFWKAPFSRTVFNSSQIYLWISRKHALCTGKKLKKESCNFGASTLWIYFQILSSVAKLNLILIMHLQFPISLSPCGIFINTDSYEHRSCMHGNSL